MGASENLPATNCHKREDPRHARKSKGPRGGHMRHAGRQDSGEGGTRLSRISRGISAFPETGDAESDALPPDSDLTRVILAWPSLSGTVRSAIVALVDEAHAEANG